MQAQTTCCTFTEGSAEMALLMEWYATAMLPIREEVLARSSR